MPSIKGVCYTFVKTGSVGFKGTRENVGFGWRIPSVPLDGEGFSVFLSRRQTKKTWNRVGRKMTKVLNALIPAGAGIPEGCRCQWVKNEWVSGASEELGYRVKGK